MKNKTDISITPSFVMEYLFCPRFIYFMEVLQIPQNEENRFKVVKGREIHKMKAMTNTDYKRKKLGVIKKESEQDLISEKYRIHGQVDEILFLNDGTAAPLDYKYAEYSGKLYKTLKVQSIMYGLMIKENYHLEVNKGYVVYTRSKHHIEQIDFVKEDVEETVEIISDILNILKYNYFPKRSGSKQHCVDCTYRNICIK